MNSGIDPVVEHRELLKELKNNLIDELENYSYSGLIAEAEFSLAITFYNPRYYDRVLHILDKGREKETRKNQNLLIKFLTITPEKRNDYIHSLTDAELMTKAKQIITALLDNPAYNNVARAILKKNPTTLSEAQRKVFYGLLNVDYHESREDYFSRENKGEL
ncbi:hypothetical protein ABGV42_01240 [Paenibacillus pabuli]|uniref:hypothetical protein n=1 Tax=Paenibacillus pabuli TaxID=1472 RepID=UPI003241C0FC